MRMSEKCHNNNNSDNQLTSRRTDGGKNGLLCWFYIKVRITLSWQKRTKIKKITLLHLLR